MDVNNSKEIIRKCIDNSVTKMQLKTYGVSLDTAIKYGHELSKINENKNLLIDKLTEEVFEQYNKLIVYNDEIVKLKKKKKKLIKLIEIEDSKKKSQVYNQKIKEINAKISDIENNWSYFMKDFTSGGEHIGMDYDESLEYFFSKELRKTELHEPIKSIKILFCDFDDDSEDNFGDNSD